MKSHNGIFITLEGGEGAGKTTLINRLAEVLQARGYVVVKTREPGGSKLSEFIRQWLLNRDFNTPVGLKAELLLFLAARAQHIEEKIQPALERGFVVLCDRFNDSTIAYQGAARGLGVDLVRDLCILICGEVRPQLTLFLDVDPEIGIRRTQSTAKDNAAEGEMDRIEAEGMAFHTRVRDAFTMMVDQEPNRIKRIDASETPEAVFEASWNVVKQIL